MDIRITPKQLTGSVHVPPSKSVAHRALIATALTKGTTTLYNLGTNDDVVASIAAITALGAICKETSDGGLQVTGITNPPQNAIIDCNESGSTLRFFVPIAAALGVTTTFLGQGELPNRPITPLTTVMEEHGASVTLPKGENEIFTISGTLAPGIYSLPGNITSQYITGLLFALSLFKEESVIELTTPLESSGYIDLTIEILKEFGVSVIVQENKYIISKNELNKPTTFLVEGDYSGAAFWLSAGAMGSTIELIGLKENSSQGDKKMIDLLKQFGATITTNHTVSISPEKLTGIEIDASEIPDCVPILSVVAAAAKGTTRIYNAGRVRIKECDRLAAMAENLQQLGVDIQEESEGLIIHGGTPLSGGIVSSFADHRIAMAMAIAALLATEPVTITGAQCVAKSYPNFFEDYQKLGGNIHVI